MKGKAKLERVQVGASDQKWRVVSTVEYKRIHGEIGTQVVEITMFNNGGIFLYDRDNTIFLPPQQVEHLRDLLTGKVRP